MRLLICHSVLSSRRLPLFDVWFRLFDRASLGTRKGIKRNCCGTARSFVEVTKKFQFENFVKIVDCLNIKKKRFVYQYHQEHINILAPLNSTVPHKMRLFEIFN